MRSGFTIVEVLIVIGVTVLLAGMVITYTNTGRSQVILSIEKARIAQNISRAKSLAVATYNAPTIPCGYGFEVDYDIPGYRVFGYQAPDCDNIDTIDGTFVEEAQAFELPSALVFDDSGGDALQYILFIPPEPKTLLWRKDSPVKSRSGIVRVMTRDGKGTSEVSINDAGQISF